MSNSITTSIETYLGKTIECAKFVIDTPIIWKLKNKLDIDSNYAISFVGKSAAATQIEFYLGGKMIKVGLTTSFDRYQCIFEDIVINDIEDTDIRISFPIGTFYIYNIQLEHGNIVTDWRAAGTEDALLYNIIYNYDSINNTIDCNYTFNQIMNRFKNNYILHAVFQTDNPYSEGEKAIVSTGYTIIESTSTGSAIVEYLATYITTINGYQIIYHYLDNTISMVTKNFANLSHTHIAADITNFNSAVDGRITRDKILSVVSSGATYTGSYSFTEGVSTTASGEYSHAEGYQTSASGGWGAHAEGSETTASSSGSHAEGYLSRATSTAAHAEGYYTTASGLYSHAEGYKTSAYGSGSHAEGNMTSALGPYSHTEGSQTNVPLYSSYSHAEGLNTTAQGFSSHAEGSNTGTYEYYTHAEGYNTYASSTAAHAEGYFTTASGPYSHAEGTSAVASSTAAHAEGYKTTASGKYAHAEGQLTKAEGFCAHAEGWYTESLGNYCHSEGDSTTASDSSTHAEGNLTIASTVCAHAEGFKTTAAGAYSHTEGASTKATTVSAHAEGNGTTASGRSSHAGGTFTIANADYQTAIGQYNATVSDALFIVGKGTATNARSNAMYVTTAGNINCVSLTQTSDRRLKDDISNISTTDLAIYDKLQPKSFTLKSDDVKSKHYGFIAQDVLQSFEELGLPSSYVGIIHQDQNEQGYYNINYTEFIALLVEKQKIMQQEIDELKAAVAALKQHQS